MTQHSLNNLFTHVNECQHKPQYTTTNATTDTTSTSGMLDGTGIMYAWMVTTTTLLLQPKTQATSTRNLSRRIKALTREPDHKWISLVYYRRVLVFKNIIMIDRMHNGRVFITVGCTHGYVTFTHCYFRTFTPKYSIASIRVLVRVHEGFPSKHLSFEDPIVHAGFVLSSRRMKGWTKRTYLSHSSWCISNHLRVVSLRMYSNVLPVRSTVPSLRPRTCHHYIGSGSTDDSG